MRCALQADAACACDTSSPDDRLPLDLQQARGIGRTGRRLASRQGQAPRSLQPVMLMRWMNTGAV